MEKKPETEAERKQNQERIAAEERKRHLAVAPEKWVAGSLEYDTRSNPIKLRGVSANG